PSPSRSPTATEGGAAPPGRAPTAAAGAATTTTVTARAARTRHARARSMCAMMPGAGDPWFAAGPPAPGDAMLVFDMLSDRLFAPLFTTEAMRTATSDEAWLQAMLDVEAALARAEADAGVIPGEAAAAITAACSAAAFD